MGFRHQAYRSMPYAIKGCDTKPQVKDNLQSCWLELARSLKASNWLRWRISTNLNEL
jgi:hypothetical protein